MGFIIEDGTGKGFTAKVAKDNHLQTNAVILSRVGEISSKDQQAYSWSSRYLVAAGSSIIFLKNTSTTQNLVIDDIEIGGTTAGEWELWTSTTAGTGVVISGTNLNRNSSNQAEASAFGNENITANGSESLLGYIKNPIDSIAMFKFNDALILGQNDAIMIKKQLTPAVVISGVALIEGYFE